MRLLYVSADPGVPILGHKGASVHVRELAGALAAEGVDVFLASPRIGAEGDSLDADVVLVELEPVRAREHRHATSLRAAIERQAAQLLRLARELEVEAIYERYSLHSCAGAHVVRALELPYLVEVNAPLRAEARRYRSLLHPEVAAEAEARTFGASDRILAVSTPLAQLLRSGGVPASKLAVLPNAVSTAKVRAPHRRGPGFTIGFAGSLKPWHGIDVLVDAVAAAATAVSDLRFEIVGDGPLAHVVDRLELPRERLRRHGARRHDDTLRIVASWHVGVAPYVEDAATFYFSPLKIVEYMAAGACPVASDLGDIPVLLGGGERGVLVPPGDASALASALVQLARDRVGTAALAARARTYANATLSWRRNAQRVLELVQAAPSRRLAHVPV